MKWVFQILSLAYLFVTFSLTAADSSDYAYLWKLINGTNIAPESNEAKQIQSLLGQGKKFDAAIYAMNQSKSSFITNTVRQTFNPIAGRETSVSNLSGDFVLTWMMAAARDISVKQLFTTDIRYAISALSNETQSTQQIHDFLNVSYSDQKLLSSVNNVNRQQTYIQTADKHLGVMTSLQYGKAMFDGGTNRRPLRKMVEDFLCYSNIENIMNTQLNDKWVGKDVERAPGGDVKVYLNKCVGCHAGMDAVRGAFANYDTQNDSVVYRTAVSNKLNNNPHNFPHGYKVVDEAWQHLGWLPFAKDHVGAKFSGAKELVKMMVESERFYGCLVTRAKNVLCSNKDLSADKLNSLATKFKTEQNIKRMYANVAADVCLED